MDIASILDSLKKIDWAISLIASIPLSILGNILTPTFQSWRARKSTERTQKRIDQLNAELEQVKHLNSDYQALSMQMYSALFKVLIFLGFGLALSSFPIIDLITQPVAALLFAMAVLSASKQYKLLRRSQNYAEYEQSIKVQIAELEGL